MEVRSQLESLQLRKLPHTCSLAQIHQDQEGAEQAARESRSIDTLEHKYAVQLDFGGISSEQAGICCLLTCH